MTVSSIDQVLALAGGVVDIAGRLAGAIQVLAQAQAEGRDLSEDERAIFRAKLDQADTAWAEALDKAKSRQKD